MKWLGINFPIANISWLLFNMDKVFAITVSDTCIDIYPKGEMQCCRLEVASAETVLNSGCDSCTINLIAPETMLTIKEKIINPDNYERIFPASFFRVDDLEIGLHAFFNRDLIAKISHHTGSENKDYKIHFTGRHHFDIPGKLINSELIRNIAKSPREILTQPLPFLDFVNGNDDICSSLQKIPEYIVSDPSLPTGIAFDIRMVHILNLKLIDGNMIKVSPNIAAFPWTISGKISPSQPYYQQLIDIRDNAFFIM